MTFLAKKKYYYDYSFFETRRMYFHSIQFDFLFLFFKIPSDYNSQMTRRTGYVAEQFESERLPEPSLYM